MTETPTPIADDFAELRKRMEKRAIPTRSPQEIKQEQLDNEARIARLTVEFRQDRIAEIVPRRYREAICDSPEVERFVAAVAGGQRPDGLLFVGPTGTGKTHDLWAMVRMLVLAGLDVRSDRMQHDLQNAYFHGVVPGLRVSVAYRAVPLMIAQLQPPANVWENIQYLIDASILILDDLGANKHSEWVEQVLFQILDLRYQEMRPTVIATNVPVKDLKDSIGERLADRIKEMCKVVTYKGSSKRKPA